MKNLIKNNLQFFKVFLRQTKGQKRRFLSLGITNVIITNTFLQFFLSFSIMPTSIATLISQLINMFLGYILYSKFVFKNKKLLIRNFIIKYIFLMTIIWLTNFYLINILVFFGLIRSFAALILIPFLAITSYIVQRYFVFKN